MFEHDKKSRRVPDVDKKQCYNTHKSKEIILQDERTKVMKKEKIKRLGFKTTLLCFAVACAFSYMHADVISDGTVYDGNFIPGSADDTIYGTIAAGLSPSDVDAGLYDMASKNGFTAGAIEDALNNGYMLGYIDLLKQGGWIPQDFTPSGSAPAASTPTPSSDSTTPSGSGTTGNTSFGTSKSETKQKAEPTKDDSIAGSYVVINADTSVYNTYSASKEKETYDIGTEVEVTGLYSNGMYEIKYNDGNGYVRQKNLVTQEDYEAAWEETESVAATCTEAGKTTYTNSLSGATKEEEIPAAGHSYEVTENKEATCTEDGKTVYTCSACGDTYEEPVKAAGHTEGKWEVTKKAKAFSKGERVKKCTVCGEILKAEETVQTFPLPLWSVIVIGAAVLAIVVVVITLIIRKNQKKAEE